MIETGPEVAAAAAWDALTEAVERSKHIALTGDAAMDKAIQEAHLVNIESHAFEHYAAVRNLRKAMWG